jgi:multidrug transporter EmrE-like cation transporter
MSTLISSLESINPLMLLLIAIACEITGTTALRVSQGFTRLLPSLWVGVSYIISFYLYSLVLKYIPMGIAYLIWGGLGGAGVVIIGALVWHDRIAPMQILGMVLIVVGTLLLNAFAAPAPQ